MSKIGRVYRIYCPQGTECYVGSTFDTIRSRFYSHKAHYNGESDYRSSCRHLFDKYGIDNCKIVLVKEYVVVDSLHLRAYEALWINKLKSINKLSALRFLLPKHYHRFYNQKNKEKLSKQCKKYYEEHKEEFREYQKEYRKQNSDTLKVKNKERYDRNREQKLAQKREYAQRTKDAKREYNKRYRENNLEKLKQHHKEYTEKNKEKLKAYRARTTFCETCNCTITVAFMKKHLQTSKHLSNLQEVNTL